MLIDWFTVIAQALNFLALVGLLKHFLYKPILHAIDAREKKIATELADADQKKSAAQKESDDFKKKNEEFDNQRAALLSKATTDANAERQRLIDEAKKDATALSKKLQETMKSEEQSLFDSIRSRVQKEVFAIARKALMDLAGATLEERIVDVFNRRLHDLSADEKGKLTAALKKPDGPLIVHSAVSLSQAQRLSIESAVKESLGINSQIQFETAADIVSGIELIANGQKVAWSIGDYITSLQRGLVSP